MLWGSFIASNHVYADTSLNQDSIIYTDLAIAWQDRQETVKVWRNELDRRASSLDSIKMKLNWQKAAPDSILLDSIRLYFDQSRRSIHQIEEQIQVMRGIWTISRSNKEDPVEIPANVIESDSLQRLSVLLLDTLDRLEGGFQRLISEIDYLEKNILRQQEELRLARTDSVISSWIPIPLRVLQTIRTNAGRDGSSVSFFDYSSWGNRILLVLISILYFYWMYRLGRKSDAGPEEFRLHENDPIWVPILKCCIFFLVLLPFASFSVPVLILELSYFLIFLFLYIILFPELSMFKRTVLGWIFFYYILLVIANLLQSELWWSRIFSVIINLSGMTLVWTMGRKTDVDNPVGYIPKYARWIIIVGHLIAILMNLFGYIIQARMWSLASGIGLLQALSLRSFRDMLLHDLENQYQRARPEAMFRRFDLRRMLRSVDRLIRFICGALIILVLFNNLHLTREIGTLLERLLVSEHQLGGINYSYGDLLMAIAVIWIANWLQKNLDNLLEKPADDEVQRRKITLFPLFRLLIIVVGFLIGISILGLGMDKLTVIIGALSVGIGLGMQNIINNFVSGVILVFEKPFKVGDYVELADKKGQVLQIGIRASTLMTDEGARVLIPNGDLLSGRLVNWTFSESDIRVNMQLTVDGSKLSIEEIKQLLIQQLKNTENVDPEIPIKVFTKEISAENYKLSIQVGVQDVRYVERFRSQFLEKFKEIMNTHEISISTS